jgi:hypothetical protein
MKMHFSVNEIDFEIFVKVLGFAYVFENGEKCNCVDVRVFVCVFVCVCVVSVLSEKTGSVPPLAKGLNNLNSLKSLQRVWQGGE